MHLNSVIDSYKIINKIKMNYLFYHEKQFYNTLNMTFKSWETLKLSYVAPYLNGYITRELIGKFGGSDSSSWKKPFVFLIIIVKQTEHANLGLIKIHGDWKILREWWVQMKLHDLFFLPKKIAEGLAISDFVLP